MFANKNYPIVLIILITLFVIFLNIDTKDKSKIMISFLILSILSLISPLIFSVISTLIFILLIFNQQKNFDTQIFKKVGGEK